MKTRQWLRVISRIKIEQQSTISATRMKEASYSRPLTIKVIAHEKKKHN